MLNFSKTNIIIVVLLSLTFIFFTITNFTKFDDELINKKINLGLDLQGGSYLLLEIDNDPVIIKELQNKATLIKNFFKNKKINIFDLKVTDNKTIKFAVKSNDLKEVNNSLYDKNETINPYYERFKSFQNK